MILRLTIYEPDGALYDIIDEDDDERGIGARRQADRLLASALTPHHPTAGMRFELKTMETP